MKSASVLDRPLTARDARTGFLNPAFSVFLSLGLLVLLSGCVAELPDLEEEKDPITAAVTVGFDPEYPFSRQGMWMPVTIVMENSGDDVSGTFVVRFKDGSVQYEEAVDLPSMSRVTLKPMIHISSMLQEAEFFLDTPFERKPLETITLSNQLIDTTKLIAVLSADRGSHQYLAQNPDSDLEDIRRVLYVTPMTNADNEVALPGMALLPDNAIGYQSLNCLIWDNGPVDQLSSVQQQALDEWIQQGGTLVLAAGEAWQELSGSAFRLYSPMNMDGSALIERGTTLLSADGGISPQLNRQAVIATGELIDDENLNLLLSADGLPLLIERPWGAGRIVFSAISLRAPMVEDDVLQEIVNIAITDAPPILQPNIINMMDEHITAFLRWILQAQLPSTQFIALYLGAYILLVVPINYLVFKKLGRLEWAWLMVPVLAIIFAVGVYYIGALRQQSAIQINQVSLLETRPGSDVAYGTTYSSIYSPVRQWYTLTFANPVAYPMLATEFDFRSQGERLSDDMLNIQFTDSGTVLNDFLVYHWSQRTFKTQQQVSIGDGIDASFGVQNGRPVGSLTNNTGFPLEQLLFEFRNRVYSKTRLDSGETFVIGPNTNLSIETNQHSGQRGFAGVIPNQYQEQPHTWMREEVQKRYLNEWKTFDDNRDTIFFSAMIENAFLLVDVNGSIKSPEGNSMVGMLIPIEQQSVRMELDRSFFVLKDAVRMPNGWEYRDMSQNQITRTISIPINRNLEFALQSLTDLGQSDVREIRLNMKYQNMIQRNVGWMNTPTDIQNGIEVNPNGERYDLHVYDFQARQFQPLRRITNPDGSLSNPQRFIDPEHDTLLFQMQGRQQEASIDVNYDLSIQVFLNTDQQTESFLGYSTREVEIRVQQAQL